MSYDHTLEREENSTPDLVGYQFQTAEQHWLRAGYSVEVENASPVALQRCRILRQRLIAVGVIAIIIGEEYYSEPSLE